MDMANRIAPYDSSLLITGETGVGKETPGRYIHSLSLRAKGTFFAINCGALPENLLESELFGHKAGSFTGAIHDRVGLFEEAQGGTLFLDEIGDITPSFQVKLPRVLQERQITRVGENKRRKINVRFISATNRNLNQLIQEASFREDLYYRLGIIEIPVPPLRERREDILPLIRYFLSRIQKNLSIPEVKIDASCIDYLHTYPWPGNIRELENAIERAALLCKNGIIYPENLPPRILDSCKTALTQNEMPGVTLKEMELLHIRNALKLTNGNQARAAKLLGIGQTTLWRKMKHLGEAKKFL